LDCGGKRSATPLWKLCPQSKSGVAAPVFASLRRGESLCHRNPKSSRRTMILTYCRDCKKSAAAGYFAGAGSGTTAPLFGCSFINSVSAAPHGERRR